MAETDIIVFEAQTSLDGDYLNLRQSDTPVRVVP